MRVRKLISVICLAILTSASVYSQDWQPKVIESENEKGLFLPFWVMDSIAVKLISAKSDKLELKNVWKMYFLSEKESSLFEMKYLTEKETSRKWRLSALNQETQKSLFKKSYESQIEINTIQKKKGRKNGLLLFGGGISVGLAAALLLL